MKNQTQNMSFYVPCESKSKCEIINLDTVDLLFSVLKSTFQFYFL